MSEAVLQVTNLVKKIKGKTILDHISFEVGQGDCLALIGPNGAGKTTLMSCILGDKKASSGQVFIKGKKGKAQDQIAVLLQENTIPSQLRVRELIAFFQDISENGLSKEEIQELLQFKGDQYQQFADKLSGGQKRLLAFVLCLIGKPDILFLDEPTAGMDTTTRQRFWEIINDLKKSGVTILYRPTILKKWNTQLTVSWSSIKGNSSGILRHMLCVARKRKNKSLYQVALRQVLINWQPFMK